MIDKEKLEKLKKLADAIYYAAFNLTTDTSPLRKAMREYRQFIIHEYHKEEPTSEELKTELNEYIKCHFTIDKEKLDKFGIEEKDYMYSMDKSDMLALVEHFTKWQKTKAEPTSEELEEAADNALNNVLNTHEIVNVRSCLEMFKFGAKWKEKEMQSTIELAEDHAYFAGKTKTIDEIKEALLSEVLPCFMHGGEADEVVAKLDEVLNQKK